MLLVRKGNVHFRSPKSLIPKGDKRGLNARHSVNEINLTSYLPISPEQYERFKKATREDEELQELRKVVIEGWPKIKYEVSHRLRVYWSVREEISCVDGLLFKSHTLIVPTVLRAEMLKIIHASHLGIVKCKSRGQESLYWPGMAASIEDTVAKCSVCAKYTHSNHREPLIQTGTPERPWQIVSTDIFGVSDMGFTAHQHKKAISRRIRYKIIRPICRKS